MLVTSLGAFFCQIVEKKQQPQHLSLSSSTMSAPPAGPPAAPGEGGPDAPQGPPNLSSNRRLQQTQVQVNEVVDLMRVNVDKVLERDQKLSELDDRADALQAGASQFETSAGKLKRKYFWKNAKVQFCSIMIPFKLCKLAFSCMLPYISFLPVVEFGFALSPRHVHSF
uniref:V-SNARE coiled-coil homology domain-containing protein n=1 Tax=Leptobrachium leishanense TaxID=445787 RepID=A0A8C5MIC9_9ANUR